MDGIFFFIIIITRASSGSSCVIYYSINYYYYVNILGFLLFINFITQNTSKYLFTIKKKIITNHRYYSLIEKKKKI